MTADTALFRADIGRRTYRAPPRGEAFCGALRRAYGPTPEPDVFALLLREIDRRT